MAPRLCTAPTQSPVWLTSFCYTNFVGWRLEAVMETRTWERPMRWVNGRHGSKPGREMIRPRLWSLPTSGSGPAGSSAPIGTYPVTPFKFRGAEPIFAASISLVAFNSFACVQACFLVQADFRSPASTRLFRTQHQTRRLRHFIRTH